MLEASDIHVSFGGRKVLQGLNFSVEASAALGVVGPNGCGKTTLFNVLCGLQVPERGEIRFCNEVITHYPAYKRACIGFGRVFQQSGVFAQMTLEENILTALESKLSYLQMLIPFGRSVSERKQKANDYLKKIGLQEKAQTLAGDLSGGQQRLLEIIRAIASGASLLLLDEPTAGLSPVMKKEVAQFLVELRDEGHTLVIIEHDMGFIEGICEEIAVVASGQVALRGTPEEVKKSEKLREIYFG